MFFLLGRRMPFLGVIIGVAFVIWGVAAHSTLREVVGVVAIVYGLVRTVGARRSR
jgi:uncharacterized membrane protein HdeD (DUF308 family)